MSATKSRKARASRDDPSVQPRGLFEEFTANRPVEEGLSIDSDELGAQFLNRATEQVNFESSAGGEAQELSINAGPPSDAALIGPNFEPDQSVWQHTVDLALRSGGVEGIDRNQGVPEGDGAVDLDPTDIREGSLWDEDPNDADEALD